MTTRIYLISLFVSFFLFNTVFGHASNLQIYNVDACQQSQNAEVKKLTQNIFLTGPYLQNVTTTGITIMWESAFSGSDTLYFGKKTDCHNQIISSSTVTNADTYVHKVVITNLKHKTKYYYKVKAEGVFSATQDFITAPSSKRASFSVCLWSDSHYPNPWSEMADYMIKKIQPDFAFNAGDISNHGNRIEDIKKVFLPYVCGTIGSEIPFYSALGNHDVGSRWGGGDLIRQYHDQPKENNSDPDGFNGSYLMMYSNVAFISIDWNKMEADLLPGAWLEQVLKSEQVQNARFSFISIHCAPYYERWQTAENDIVKKNLPLLAEKYNVDAVFSGHMHGYERGDKNGVVYITMGGGSYMDKKEPVGPEKYDHIIRGTDKTDNPGNFNNGLNNNIISLEIKGKHAKIKLHYFNREGEYMGVIETVKL